MDAEDAVKVVALNAEIDLIKQNSEGVALDPVELVDGEDREEEPVLNGVVIHLEIWEKFIQE